MILDCKVVWSYLLSSPQCCKAYVGNHTQVRRLNHKFVSLFIFPFILVHLSGVQASSQPCLKHCMCYFWCVFFDNFIISPHAGDVVSFSISFGRLWVLYLPTPAGHSRDIHLVEHCSVGFCRWKIIYVQSVSVASKHIQYLRLIQYRTEPFLTNATCTPHISTFCKQQNRLQTAVSTLHGFHFSSAVERKYPQPWLYCANSWRLKSRAPSAHPY